MFNDEFAPRNEKNFDNFLNFSSISLFIMGIILILYQNFVRRYQKVSGLISTTILNEPKKNRPFFIGFGLVLYASFFLLEPIALYSYFKISKGQGSMFFYYIVHFNEFFRYFKLVLLLLLIGRVDQFQTFYENKQTGEFSKLLIGVIIISFSLTMINEFGNLMNVIWQTERSGISFFRIYNFFILFEIVLLMCSKIFGGDYDLMRKHCKNKIIVYFSFLSFLNLGNQSEKHDK
jgi:hypothetical protein